MTFSNSTPPPTGTVTFLFTDIEGSTALYEDYPYQMQAARKRHDEILRSSIESEGGYVFKTVGDEFCAAFPTATQAVQAALAAQRALLAEQWPENITVRVRMGLHTGVAEESEGDYFGPPVNRVARLMSTGHGGQVLLSDATYNLVRDALVHMEPEADLHYLGEHRLKDLRYTERIFQLVVPDLPKEFPPLKTRGLVTPPQIIDLDHHYHRIGYLGSGSFGNVYLVYHRTLDKNMALKVLGRQYAEDEQFLEDFKREARSVAKLNHPNIVQVYDAGEGLFEGQKVSYIAMECVSGGTLEDLLAQRGGPLPVRMVTELALQVAKALEAAHRSGLIHRNIKPQNILLTKLGEAKVADFGITGVTDSPVKMRGTGPSTDTLDYQAPEVVYGAPASPKSDQYALGVVLYQMLTGRLPFTAETPAEIMAEPSPAPKDVNPDVPERLNGVVMRLLAKHPEDRYRDVCEFSDEFRTVLHSPKDGEEGRMKEQQPIDVDGGTVQNLTRPVIADETDAAPPTVEVPDVLGQAVFRAGSVLADAGLTLGSQKEIPSETSPEGEILSQSPEARTKVKPESPVNVTVSSGPEKAAVQLDTPPVHPPRARPESDGNEREQHRRVLPWALAAGLVVALALIGVGWFLLAGTQDRTAPSRELKLSNVNWDENVAVSALTKVLLEDELGYTVKLQTPQDKLGFSNVDLQTLDLTTLFQGVANGDLDAFQDVWLPNHQRFVDEQGDSVELLDPWFRGQTRIGIAVPSYMNISTILQLNQTSAKEILGIEPGAVISKKVTDEVIPTYNLKQHYVASSTPSMLYEVQKRYSSGEEFAFIAWSPHWMNQSYDFHYLEDPQDILGELNYSARITTIVRKDLKNDDPTAYAFMQALTLTEKQLNDLEETMFEAGDPEKGARTWAENNPDVVKPWIDAAKRAQEKT